MFGCSGGPTATRMFCFCQRFCWQVARLATIVTSIMSPIGRLRTAPTPRQKSRRRRRLQAVLGVSHPCKTRKRQWHLHPQRWSSRPRPSRRILRLLRRFLHHPNQLSRSRLSQRPRGFSLGAGAKNIICRRRGLRCSAINQPFRSRPRAAFSRFTSAPRWQPGKACNCGSGLCRA